MDGKRRSMAVRPQEQHEALQAHRQRQQTPEFKQAYAKRAGVEGTMSQSVRGCGVWHARYVRLPKTRLQHLASASALKLLRLADWLEETPRAKHATQPLPDECVKLPEHGSHLRFTSGIGYEEDPIFHDDMRVWKSSDAWSCERPEAYPYM